MADARQSLGASAQEAIARGELEDVLFADDTIFAPSFEGKSSEVRLDREKQEVIVNEINGEFDLDVVEDDDTFSDLLESTLAGDSKNEEE